jgi:hypothetical protein
VNVHHGIRCETPPKSGTLGNDDNHRYEHAADSITKPLDVGATGLGALHGGDNVRQGRGFAGSGNAYDEPAIEIYVSAKS